MANQRVEYFKISCVKTENFNHVQRLLTELCHPDYALEVLSGTRIKKHFKGRCVWSAHYRLVNGNVGGKRDFDNGVENLTINKPFGAKLCYSGRYAGPNYGIVIQWGHVHCNCNLDFDQETTLFLLKRSQNSCIEYDVSCNDTGKTQQDIKSFLDTFNSATNAVVIVVDGNSTFHEYIRNGNYVLNLAHVSFILNLKQMIIMINEDNTWKICSGEKRFDKVKKTLCGNFNSSKWDGANLTFAKFTVANDDIEIKESMPSLKHMKLNLTATAIVTFIEKETSFKHTVSVAVAATS